ncbi:sulfatase-like hydrolase/transferase [Anaerocolumna sp. AGMB13025]|uniref:sulfatase-like hydrolase/transferase n=1 Tax=Anaerocolumna sp. AGMB13025 TaxID=3039116 RepID=UPI0024200E14|nr:sulfatase-like hydrolase/transferase [Anaerocolumna sp. AGMB13025]WFR59910.1 sulfatase-like hydrolase/transferase [Anaerocolumna sp. AGMB13025]
MRKKDILIFLSDQHAGPCTGYAGDDVIHTPNLDRIAAKGTVFDAAYTSCPLCVPARMSFLSGQLPTKMGVLDNAGSIPSDQVTFLHSLGAQGYETVLCGRMHFEGPDQRHGFTKRIFGDITPIYTGDRSSFREMKHFGLTLTELGCLNIIGGGNSPTLEYDRHVIRTALDYLSKDHEKPQCIVVGTYAPHFPYVAPTELYNYYLEKVKYPLTLSKGCNHEHPILKSKLKDTKRDTVIKARAAYWGMIEFMDRNIGLVYEAWEAYLNRNKKEGVFLYLSDHGDQVGERGLYGKKTFFEMSAHIPMIFMGSGIAAGVKIKKPCSIMDVGPTICELTGAEPLPEQDGKSLVSQLESGIEVDRYVFSEILEGPVKEKRIPGRMVRMDKWKYITYAGYEDYDLLFNLEEDPHELVNLFDEQPDIVKEMRKIVHHNWDTEKIINRYAVREKNLELQAKWFKNSQLDQSERWIATPEALEEPENFYQSSIELPEHITNRIKKIMGE